MTTSCLRRIDELKISPDDTVLTRTGSSGVDTGTTLIARCSFGFHSILQISFPGKLYFVPQFVPHDIGEMVATGYGPHELNLVVEIGDKKSANRIMADCRNRQVYGLQREHPFFVALEMAATWGASNVC